ncbi:MAG: VTT domain-containing protein [Clostridia bacterium]|nr:VTT domain-containing protein [Clostridia bacterium]
MTKKARKQKTISKILLGSAVFSFCVAVVLIVILCLLQIDAIKEKYDEYLYILQDFEIRVAALRSRWLIFIVIFLLFLLRSLSMMYPYPMIFIITAMVFPPYQSFFINLAGMAFTFAFRYYTGYEMGEGTINFALKKYPAVMSAMEEDGKGNPIILLALRMVPSLPINTISHFYGSLEYSFPKYMLLSLGAYVPKLISYSFIGNNVYDPFSADFFVPMIVLLVFTGICLLVLRAFLQVSAKIKNNDKSKQQTN